MIPVETETTIEPDEDGDERSTSVYASIHDTEGQNHMASTFIPGEATDEQVADALIKVALAAAQMHSSGAWMALQQRLREVSR